MREGFVELFEARQQHAIHPAPVRFDGSLDGPFPIRDDIAPDDHDLRPQFSCGLQQTLEMTRMDMRVSSVQDLHRNPLKNSD